MKKLVGVFAGTICLALILPMGCASVSTDTMGTEVTQESAAKGEGAAEGGVWTELQPVGSVPRVRMGHGMVCEEKVGRLVLFGGVDVSLEGEGTYLQDTWAYDPAANSWVNLDPAGDVPAPRSSHCMAYDPDGGRVILFGGAGFGGESRPTCFNDTWSYDHGANTWTDLDPVGPVPPPRSSGSMAYEPVSDRLFLFGGAPAPETYPTTKLNLDDIWAYDPIANTWTALDPSGALPPGRHNAGLAYERAGGRLILFGGQVLEADGNVTYLDDTWAYDPVADAWMEIIPAGGRVPSARSYHSLVCEPSSGRLFLFGGMDDRYFNSEMWTYDCSDNTWTQLCPAEGHAPSSRVFHSLVYEPTSGGLILFGGAALDAEGHPLGTNDIWAYALGAGQ